MSMPKDRQESVSVATAFLTAGDGRNPRSWSGIPFHIAAALERHLGPVTSLGPMPAWPGKLLKAGARLNHYFDDRRGGQPAQSERLSRFYGRVAGHRLAVLRPRPDLVFSPVGSALIAHLKTDLPVVYSSDATAAVMFDYYPQFTGLSERARRMADDLERRAIARADLLLYPTRWAADSAIADYGAPPEKVRVLPYGANLSEVPVPADPETRDESVCRLLMVGVNWSIKGGAIAVETLRALRAMGVAAELTVVGCAPPEAMAEAGLRFIPFLDKNRAEDRARLNALYRDAGFFILPSRCECYGIVFCEAAAHGLPAIATRTGGVPEVVREGENGFTLPLAEDGAAYAARIAALWADRSAYRALRRASRRAFETRLNWDVWGEAAAEEIRGMLAERTSAGRGAAQA